MSAHFNLPWKQNLMNNFLTSESSQIIYLAAISAFWLDGILEMISNKKYVWEIVEI